MAKASRFDADYYRRFYDDPDTRVTTPASRKRLARFVGAYLRHLDLPVLTVLDLGCGRGHWRKQLATEFPRARYTGVEVSPYLCRKHGWQRGSVVDFDPGETYDLVICQGVLQYLDGRAAARAIANLGRLTAGALYMEALTRSDWEVNCDQSVTDGEVHLRTGDWYRQRLHSHFSNCGGGIFLARSAPATTFELETLE